MQIQMVPINKLKPHPKNPRVHPSSLLDKLQRSIKEFGWTNPVLVSADGYILAGHARLKAAKKAGIKEVPVIYLPLEGAKAEAYMVADNRLQDESKWDDDLLRDVLEDLKYNDLDMILTGFEEHELDSLLDIVPEPDLNAVEDAPEVAYFVVSFQLTQAQYEEHRDLIAEISDQLGVMA